MYYISSVLLYATLITSLVPASNSLKKTPFPQSRSHLRTYRNTLHHPLLSYQNSASINPPLSSPYLVSNATFFNQYKNRQLVKRLFSANDKADTFLNDQKPGNYRGYQDMATFNNDMVDQTFDFFVISLDRQLYRLKELDDIMIKNQIRYRRVIAVDGSDLIPINQAQSENLVVSPNPAKGEYSGMYSRNALGSTLTHIKAIYYASQSKKKYSVIIEDDLRPRNYFHEQLQDLIPSLEEYKPSYLYLGATTPFNLTTYRDNRKTMYPVSSNQTIGRGAFAYIIEKESATALLNKIITPPIDPADWFPYRQYKFLKPMAVNPLFFSVVHTMSHFDKSSTWSETQ